MVVANELTMFWRRDIASLDHRQIYWTPRTTGEIDQTGNLPQRSSLLGKKNFQKENHAHWIHWKSIVRA